MVRLFGRGKDDSATEPTCASCGRTLLPGEWAQNVVREDGQEVILCSLCAQYEEAPATAPDAEAELFADQPIAVTGRPAPAARGRSPQHEQSDAFWKALKDRDAEIERLRGEIGRLQAERQALASQLAEAHERLGEPPPHHADTPTEAIDVLAYTSAPYGEGESPDHEEAAVPDSFADAWGQAPAAAAVAAATSAGAGEPDADEDGDATAQIPAADVPVIVDATAGRASGKEGSAGEDVGEGPAVAPAETSAVSPDRTEPWEGADPGVPQTVAVPAPTGFEQPGIEPAPLIEPAPEGTFFAPDDESTGAFTEPPTTALAEQAISEGFDFGPPVPRAEPLDAPNAVELSLLQRGIDLFNVSAMPRRVAETSELLGLPHVNATTDGDTVTAILVWSMAWYEYQVTLEDGDVQLKDRGYDDRSDLPAVGSVRADGTIQLNSLAARSGPVVVRPVPVEHPPAADAADEATGEMAGVREPAPEDGARPAQPSNPDMIAKSLKGNRTDDEGLSWDGMSARDFDWSR